MQREKDMQLLAQKYGGYLRPEVANSKETIALLYDLARARNMPRYIKEAEDKAKKASETVREEKRKAFSESSGSSSAEGGSPKFEDLSLEEMRRRLPISNKE